MGFSGLGLVPVYEKLGNDLVGVEIGVDKGESTFQFIEQCPNIKKIYAIDPWRAYDASFKTKIQSNMDANYETTKNRLKKYTDIDKIKIIRKPSLEAVSMFDDNFFDWSFIDGDHSEEAAFADMQAWYPKIKRGGVLAGHDYRTKDIAVRAAVKRFSELHGLEIHETEYWAWYFNKPK